MVADDVQRFGFVPPTPLELSQRRLAFACRYIRSSVRLDLDVSSRVDSALGGLIFPPDFDMRLYKMNKTSLESQAEHAAQIICKWPEPGRASDGKPNGMHCDSGSKIV